LVVKVLLQIHDVLMYYIYHMLQRGEPYQDLGADYFTQRRKEVKVDYLLRQLEKLGVSIQIESAQMQMSPG
jgi:transposase